MSMYESIHAGLSEALSPEYLSLGNESDQHNVPANSETHFKVICVSSVFEGQSRVRRHQHVYGLLVEAMANGVHALALHLYTPLEWAQKTEVPASPECMGGS